MEALVPIFVAVINAVAALGPSLAGFIQRVSLSSDLSADGKALLDSIEASIDRHVANLDKVKPLPLPHAGSPTVEGELVPEPKPTAPG